jgi:hypothetical protein
MHNARRYDSEESYPQNIDPKREHSTIYYKGVDDYYSPEQTDLDSIVRHRIESNNVKGIKSNGRVAIEYVLGISDVGAWDNYSADGYFLNCKHWLEQRHGEGSVVAYSLHEDESNPHAHFVVVPIVTKDVRWKNAKGEGVRTEARMNIRDSIKDGSVLRQLQQDYYEFASRFAGKMGVPIYRGTLKENQNKEYTALTDHKIGQIRTELSRLARLKVDLVDYLKKKAEMLSELLNRKELEKERSEIEKLKAKPYNKSNWWKKGTSSESFFHGEDPEHKKDKPKNNNGLGF